MPTKKLGPQELEVDYGAGDALHGVMSCDFSSKVRGLEGNGLNNKV